MREQGLSRREATAVFDDEYRVKILPDYGERTIFVGGGQVRMWVLNEGVVGKELTTGNPGYVADHVEHQHVRLAASPGRAAMPGVASVDGLEDSIDQAASTGAEPNGESPTTRSPCCLARPDSDLSSQAIAL